MSDSFEQTLAARLSEINAPAGLGVRVLTASRLQAAPGHRTGVRDGSRLRVFAGLAVTGIMLSLVVIGRLGEVGPTNSYSLAGLTVVSSQVHLPSIPTISQSDASDRAVQWLTTQWPRDYKFRVEASSYHAAALRRVMDAAGYVTYQTSSPHDAYVFWLSATPRDGQMSVTALVIVNASNGSIDAAQLREKHLP